MSTFWKVVVAPSSWMPLPTGTRTLRTRCDRIRSAPGAHRPEVAGGGRGDSRPPARRGGADVAPRGDLILLAKSRRPDLLNPQPVSLERLTHSLLAKARGLGQREWQVDAAGEGIVSKDEQRITQAVLQLADNAVKHTDDGAEVGVGPSYDGRVARIWVRDTGDGVAPEHHDQIFERFGRSTVRSGDDGFGLGLSIVRAIATAHGGSVAVEECRPRGARFVIALPVLPIASEEHPWHAS